MASLLVLFYGPVFAIFYLWAGSVALSRLVLGSTSLRTFSSEVFWDHRLPILVLFSSYEIALRCSGHWQRAPHSSNRNVRNYKDIFSECEVDVLISGRAEEKLPIKARKSFGEKVRRL